MTPTAFKILGAALLAAAALQGCSPMRATSQGASQPLTLNDTAWTLASLPGATLLPGPQATLQFAGGRATGSDGCNRFRTSFTAADGKLELGPLRASTQMACPEPATQLAAAFNRALNDARGYRIETGSLLLLNAGGATLASLAAQPDTLAGTAWQVSGYNNGKQAVVSVITDTRLTMEFLGDGKLRGSGGCNTFNGSFTAEGNRLTIGRVASTRIACEQPEGRMAQEAAFLAALETVASARREADRLELRTASGALAVSARLAAPAKP
jgi:heat shock protein HslJ